MSRLIFSKDQVKGLPIKGLLGACLILLVVAITILLSVPPVSKDALVHHLAVPKLYLRHGGMYEIPAMPFSYYPMNLQLLYLIPLYFGNDIIPKIIHFFFALLTGGLIYRYVKHRLGTTYALYGAVFFLSTPIIVKLSISAYVDLGLIFFSTASLLLLLRWMDTGFRLRHLILAAVCCGLSMGTKYNGLISTFLLTLFVPFIYSRYARGKSPGFFRSAGQGLIFLCIAVLMFSPWMARNIYWKNNPIYPKYDNWFNPAEPVLEDRGSGAARQEKGGGLFTYRTGLYGETWWEISLLPVRIFFEGKDGDPRYFDGKLNPFLLLLPIFAFYGNRKCPGRMRSEKKIILVFAVLFFLFAFFSTDLRVRYISPIIPPLVILGVFGTRNIIQMVLAFSTRRARRTGMVLTGSALTLLFGMNAWYIADQYSYVTPFSYLTGALDRNSYISRYRFEYPAMLYVNKNLAPDARILFLFLGKRGYYCDREYLPNRHGDLKQLVKSSKDARGVWRGLRQMGITHLVIQSAFFDRWANDVFSHQEQGRLRVFFNEYLVLLYSRNGVGVFELPVSPIG